MNNNKETGTCLIAIANSYFRLEHYQEAVKWYKKAIKLEKTNKFAYNGLGNAYDLLGDSK